MSFRRRNVTLARTPPEPSSAPQPPGSSSTTTSNSGADSGSGGSASLAGTLAAQESPAHASTKITASADGVISAASAAAEPLPGVRPSPLTGQPVTSTGIPSLDGLLAGHGGLPVGHSLLVGEEGTTDYAGVACRLFAAQGITHGHVVHVVGVPESWGRDLPGVVEHRAAATGSSRRGNGGGSVAARPPASPANAAGAAPNEWDMTRGDPPGDGATVSDDSNRSSSSASTSTSTNTERERMKIAWRYERLGQFGEDKRGGWVPSLSASNPSAVDYGAKVLFLPFPVCLFKPRSLPHVPPPNAQKLRLCCRKSTKIKKASACCAFEGGGGRRNRAMLKMNLYLLISA